MPKEMIKSIKWLFFGTFHTKKYWNQAQNSKISKELKKIFFANFNKLKVDRTLLYLTYIFRIYWTFTVPRIFFLNCSTVKSNHKSLNPARIDQFFDKLAKICKKEVFLMQFGFVEFWGFLMIFAGFCHIFGTFFYSTKLYLYHSIKYPNKSK